MPACVIPVHLITDSTQNAFTTGDRIVIHSSLLRIARTDAQLPMVVGHELDKQKANELLGRAGGFMIDVGLATGKMWTGGLFMREFGDAGRLAFGVDFEREADYVGAYYAARAGYDLVGAEEFWRSYSLENPDSIRAATTHPVTSVRFVQIQKVVAEIADKRRRNVPLIPEVKVSEAEAETIAAENTR